jgi:hypothetical protein
MNWLALLALLLVGPTVSGPELQLTIEAPPSLSGLRARLESFDRKRFTDIAQLVGITDAGRPIHVRLAVEDSDVAHSVPPWVAGFAVGRSDSIVIFPDRSPRYPNDTLEDVLRHEVAHILIHRASGGRAVPRWFDEGLAMAAERERRFQDQTQLLYQLVSGPRSTLLELDRSFSGSENDQTRAYALAGALVRYVMQRFGAAKCAEVLATVQLGSEFDAAFASVIGATPTEVESEFWQRQRIWTTWIPILSSATTLWSVITVLAILAIYRRRQRNRAIEAQWDEEEKDLDPGRSPDP